MVGELYCIVSGLLKREASRKEYIRTIKNYIYDQPSGNTTVQEIAKYMHLNRQYVSEIFTRHTGIPIRDYILKMRMRRAKMMLRRGYTVGECAELTGYANIYSFSKAFKKVCGVTPSHYSLTISQTDKGTLLV